MSLDVAIFEKSRVAFREFLRVADSVIYWNEKTERVLDAISTAQEYGSVEASLSMNAGLVAAEIAGLLGDGEGRHVIDSLSCVYDSIDFYADSSRGILKQDASISQLRFSLQLRERVVEEQDIRFLKNLPFGQWTNQVISQLKTRSEYQICLLVYI